MCMYHAGFLLHRLIHVIDCTERLLSEEGSVYTNIGTHDHMLIWLLVCLQNILIPLWFRCRWVLFHRLFGTFILFLPLSVVCLLLLSIWPYFLFNNCVYLHNCKVIEMALLCS